MNAHDQARLRRICAEVLGMEPDDFASDTAFFDDLNLDRSDLADVIVAIEDAFDIELEAGIAEIETFEDLEGLVEDLIPA